MLETYLGNNAEPLGQTSHSKHQIRHYNPKYTIERAYSKLHIGLIKDVSTRDIGWNKISSPG